MPELVIDPQDGTPPLALDWKAGYGIPQGPLGLGLPPRVLIERERADGQGTDIVGTRIGARDITIPVDVYAKSRPEFLARRARLQVIAGRSSHLRPVRITYIEDDGTREWVEGVYVGGLEGDSSDDRRSELFAVRLRAGRPYWHLSPVTETWSIRSAKGRNWFPLLGNYPTASVVGGRRDVFVPGDVEVRAPWIIRGPGSGLYIRNHTAGWELRLDHEIPEDGPGSLITITTERGEQAVRDGFNNNLFGRILNGPSGGWEMGPLLPGINDIETRLDGSDRTSSVSIPYDPLKLAA